MGEAAAQAEGSVFEDIPKVVIDQIDEDAIRQLLDEFLQHTRSPDVRFSSKIEPYLDCAARKKLLKNGWKAVPYLIEHIGRQEAVDAYEGAALIDDPSVKTPADIFAYNRSRKGQVHEETLSGFICDIVLHELPSGREAPPLKARGAIGYHYNRAFRWLTWWQTNRHHFEFRTEKPLKIAPARDEHSSESQVKIDIHDGLMDVYAVSTRYGDIIRRAAEATKLKVTIGPVRGLDVITTVRMKSVTFEEFLYILGKKIDLKGLDFHKHAEGYHIGS